jgi:hypothetical protein
MSKLQAAATFGAMFRPTPKSGEASLTLDDDPREQRENPQVGSDFSARPLAAQSHRR